MRTEHPLIPRISKTHHMPSPPFSNLAGERILSSLREVFEKKRVFQHKDRLIMFVCGGPLADEKSLRRLFIDWIPQNLPRFVCILAEDAMYDSFTGEGSAFVNLAKLETVIAEVSDCVVIFPESVGSFAEAGFFANSRIRKKTLVVNPHALQSVDSFLNLGPIAYIDEESLLKPRILLNISDPNLFTPIQDRLKRVTLPSHRERLPYKTFGKFSFKQKLVIVFEMLRFLSLANIETLRHVLVSCFGGNPRYQELIHILRILLAANFIERYDLEHFKVVPGVTLIEIEKHEAAEITAQILFFYQKHCAEMYDAVTGNAE